MKKVIIITLVISSFIISIGCFAGSSITADISKPFQSISDTAPSDENDTTYQDLLIQQQQEFQQQEMQRQIQMQQEEEMQRQMQMQQEEMQREQNQMFQQQQQDLMMQQQMGMF